MTEQEAEIVVIGGGTMGSMISWSLSSRGYKVVCLESYEVAHSRSAVAGDSRLFRRSYRGTAELDEVLSIAERQWNDLNSASNEDVFVNCGGLYIGQRQGQYLTELAECCRRNHIEHEVLSADEIRQRFPQHRVSDEEAAVYEPSAGFLRTERAVHAAFRLAETAGTKVIPKSPVLDVHESDDEVVVSFESGTISTDMAIIAAGTGSPPLLPPRLRESLGQRREILTWFPVLNPAEFAPANFPIFVHIDGDYSAYGTPALDGSALKSTLDNRARPVDEYPEHRHILTPGEIAESEATATRFFKGIHPQVSRQECLADLYTTDRQAIVGKLPGKTRTYVATGFSGAGFKMSAGVGEMLAQSIAGERSGLPPFWDPSRLS